MLKGFGNLVDILKNAKDIQARMDDVQKELARKRFDAEAGGGAVRITVDGRGAVVDVKIDPAAVRDVELLEDLVKAAVGAATARAHDAMRQEVARLTGGLNIPGLDNVFSGQ